MSTCKKENPARQPVGNLTVQYHGVQATMAIGSVQTSSLSRIDVMSGTQL